MGTPKSSQAPAKQRTISSFFTPKASAVTREPANSQSLSQSQSQSPKPTKAAATARGKGVAAAKKKDPEPEDEDGEDEEIADIGAELGSSLHHEDEAEEDEPVRPRRRLQKKRALSPSSEEDSDAASWSDSKTKSKATKKLRRSPSFSPSSPEQAPEPKAVFPPPKKKNTSKDPSKYIYKRRKAVDTEMEIDMEDENGDDGPTAAQKAELREKFIKKLGRPDNILAQRDRLNADDLPEASDVENDDEEELGPIAKKFGKGKAPATKGKKAGPKLTPLEKQVVDIKRANSGTVLVVEVGYKFRFFGADAQIASQVLSIMCIPGKMRFDSHPSEAHLDKFASASIPVPRLHVHVKRLVAAGYKVGVVRQIETAALKAAGDNRNAPFERRLTNLYTKGTYIDDVDGIEDAVAPGGSAGGNTGFLLCVTEKAGGGTGADERCKVGIVAVQPATGEVVWDEFDDGFMRSEIETRLLHIAPCEFLIVGELTKATEKLVSHLAGSTTTVFGDKIRVERVERKKGQEASASAHVSKFYADKVDDSPEAHELLDTVTSLPDLVTLCLSAMITHLSDYGLEHVFDLTRNFQPFSAREHMLLNGNTLSSLEIYRNQTDFTPHGSLFWTLDRTKTKFGRRLLRKWVGRPLLDKARLEERIQAVEEVKDAGNRKIEKLKELLAKIHLDLEKGLIRIYYGKCSRPELLGILQALAKIAGTFEKVDTPEEVGFKSNILNEAVFVLPQMREVVEGFLGGFNHLAAGKDDKYEFFRDGEEFEEILEHKMGIAAVEHDLQEHLKEAAEQVKRKKLSYVTVAGIEYLLEIPNDKASLKHVPANWAKISGTKKVSRFHTPAVARLLRERDQHKESLSLACDRAFRELLSKISAEYQLLRDSIHALATLDAIFSLATTAANPSYCKPEIVEEPCVVVEDARHPMVEQLLLDAYVPNDIALSSSDTRVLMLTGPNMGGKSSYVRQVALIAIMAQIGSYVPARSAKVGMMDAVFTRMGAFDNMLKGESTFMVELKETSDILKMMTRRSLVVLDELGRGTSTHDGVAIAGAVLEEVVRRGALGLFVTHYPALGAIVDRFGGEVRKAFMGFEEKGDGSEDITFLYKLVEGLAHRSYGLNVARLAGVPKSCLETAAIKSKQLEDALVLRESAKRARIVCSLLEDGDEGGEGEWDPVALLEGL
ncbi:Mismatch repair protein msh3 [Rhizina undulata]